MKSSRKRLDGVNEVVTKQVEVSRLVTPKFLTLTKMPAGQVAFKVVRGDQEKENTVAEPKALPVEGRRRRIRSTTRSALLYIDFPEGTTMEEAQAVVEEYGLEDYELVQEGDKVRCRRSDLTEIPEGAITVQIGAGRKAGIVRSEAVSYPPPQDALPHIAVVAIDFKSDSFATSDAVMAYLKRKDIDFLEKGVENTDTGFRVLRAEVEEGTETRQVEIEPGVTALVMRAAVQDCPTCCGTGDCSPFTEVVSDTAYGRWGWGQVDFLARLADVEFCEAASEAARTLTGVVDDILFYSQLPVSVRKELVSRAASQFSAYIGSLIDALPAKVVLINRSNLEKLKEPSMTNKTVTQGTAVTAARTDDTNTPVTDAAKTAPAAEETQTAEDTTAVTRSEVEAMITKAVAAAVATFKVVPEETAQRTDTPPDAATAAIKALEEVVTRSVSPLADTLKDVGERLSKIEGATTLRSDGGDNGTVAAPKDPFVGVFSQNLK